LINSLSSHEISAILKNFGEERFHRKIAESVIKQRLKHPIESTEQLKDLILKSVPVSYRRERIHPATRAFQAFRIAVNRELEALDMALDKAVHCLKNKGRLCVISFHSLEDRIVKQKFKQFSKQGLVTLLTKKPLGCDQEEVEKNNRSRSARFRAIEKK
jgi:16S rRNA (cytosine1402-N4)-methyltransferase